MRLSEVINKAAARERLVKFIEMLHDSSRIFAKCPMADPYNFTDAANEAARRVEEKWLYDAVCEIDKELKALGIETPVLPVPKWATYYIHEGSEEPVVV